MILKLTNLRMGTRLIYTVDDLTYVIEYAKYIHHHNDNHAQPSQSVTRIYILISNGSKSNYDVIASLQIVKSTLAILTIRVESLKVLRSI